jgi:hypothetical protein
VLVASTKQRRQWANKAGGPTGKVGLQDRWAYKAGDPSMPGVPTMQVGLQGRWAYKEGGPTRPDE